MLSTGERQKLSQLQIGEKILSFDYSTRTLVFSEVIMFLDRSLDEDTNLLKIIMASGKQISITPTHLLLTGSIIEPKIIYAGHLKEGDILLTRNDKNNLIKDSVIKIVNVKSNGVIAPLTAAGTVIVDDVVASCYAVIDNQSIAHWAFLPVRIYTTLKHNISGIWLLLHKSLSSWKTTQTLNAYSSNGIHWYPKILYRIASVLLPAHLSL